MTVGATGASNNIYTVKEGDTKANHDRNVLWLTAQWKLDTYDIVFEKNPPILETGDEAKVKGEIKDADHIFRNKLTTVSVPGRYIANGYRLKGWSLDPLTVEEAEATTEGYFAPEEFVIASAPQGMKLHFYAMWERKYYKLIIAQKYLF